MNKLIARCAALYQWVAMDGRLFLRSKHDTIREEGLTAAEAADVSVLKQDGAAVPSRVLAGLWIEWMLGSARSARSTVLASTSLDQYPHQMTAVYDYMLPQPELRFLLADEPGTGKTIMSGLWLREAQRLGSGKTGVGSLSRASYSQMAGRF